MSTLALIADLKEWAEEKLCDIKFKQQAEINTDSTYSYNLVKPAVFTQFLPDTDRLPDGVNDIFPCMLLQWDNDEKKPMENKATCTIRLDLAIWNPGTHAPDIIGGDPSKVEAFKRNGEGWQDIVNWIDRITRELCNNDIIKGKYRIRHEDGLRSGRMDEQGTIYDYYPFYLGFVEFSIEYTTPKIKPYNDLLQEFLK